MTIIEKTSDGYDGIFEMIIGYFQGYTFENGVYHFNFSIPATLYASSLSENLAVDYHNN